MQIAAKDLKIEFRSKSVLTMSFLFSLLMILCFRFAFSGSIEIGAMPLADLASASLWVCFSFAAIVGMHSSFEKERDRETLDGLMLCPVERGGIFLGKVLSNLIVVFIVDLLSILFFALFFAYYYADHLAEVIIVAFVGTISLVIVGTLVAAIAVNARAREALFPILLIPLVVFSTIMPAVSATRSALSGSFGDAFQQLQMIAGFAIIFAVVGYFTFEYIMEG